jgi:hypothetical protein
LTQGKIQLGGVVCPVIISTDKTHLTNFSGDKKAYPVYLTIGNISKDVRRKPTSYSSTLIGYLPVAHFESFSNPKVPAYRLFHKCMKTILELLMDAGKVGIEIGHVTSPSNLRLPMSILVGRAASV